MRFDIDRVRSRFPALALCDGDQPRIYLDNPAGTQVPQLVMDRMRDCLLAANANLGGEFRSSLAAEQIVDEAHAAMANFVNAASPREIVFGQNMTTLTFALSRSLGRLWQRGDEILVTRMDHDANITPWLMLAEDHGFVIRWLDFDPGRCELRLDELANRVNERTRLIAIGYASNVVGTINDVRAVVAAARSAGALTFVDAVQYAPHGLIDVQALGCDLLVCSAYKFFGPHQGILWGRAELLESLTAYKVRPAPQSLPGRFETGTQSHEGMAGVTAAVDYLASLGEASVGSRRSRLEASFAATLGHEQALTRRLIDGLESLPGVRIWGITEPGQLLRRVPTVAFTVRGHEPREIAAGLARRNVFVWSGHNYAVELIDRLGLAQQGGVVRIGIAHYNTAAEIDRLIAVLAEILER